jgi:hypothetical protein
MRKIQNSILLLLFCTFSALAQENDFQFWSSFSTDDKVTYKTDIILKQGLRFRENASLLSKSFTDIKLKYKYNKKIAVAVGFRDINEWNKQLTREQKTRYYTDLYLKKMLDRFMLTVRNRYQKQGNTKGYAYVFRQELSLKYNIRKNKLEPILAAEYFYTEQQQINKLRYTLGFSYPITKKVDLAIAYRVQQQLYIANPETLFIFEGKLSYDF